MKIKCLIVDDDMLAIAVIENYISKLPDFELVTTCENPLDAYQVLHNNAIDLLFLDVEMPNLTGIEFLKTLNRAPKVIITSGNRDYAADGFELNVLDYMIKPVTFERFLKSINRFRQTMVSTSPAPASVPATSTPLPTASPEKTTVSAPASSSDIMLSYGSDKTPYLFVKENKKMVKVYLNEILYIESIKDYVKIVTESNKKIVTKYQLSVLEEELADKKFLRIHRSYLVSIPKIDAFTAVSVEIKGIQLPIGRSHKEGVIEVLRSSIDL